MKPIKTLAGIASTSALVFGGVDASVLKEEPIERVEQVAGYEIRAEQKENTVETAFPWKDQPGFKVKYDMGEPSITEKVKDKRNKEVITEVVTDFEGGFKVDILLNEKPDTNKFCYTIEGAENYDFFYQPPLTQEEKDQGSYRPPEIEGSYAVYHKTLKNHIEGQENYATGKVMHIPRPQVWELDNESEKVWADLSYDAGQLCVTVPQDFIDNAKYPVRVDPTFGYTTVGASDSATFALDDIRAVFGTLPGAAEIDSISFYVDQVGAGTASVKGVVFSSSTKTIVTDGITSEVVLTDGYAWSTTTFSTKPSVPTGDYFSGIIHDFTFGLNFKIDSTASDPTLLDSTNSFTSPTDPTDGTVTNSTRYSMYATFNYATRTIELVETRAGASTVTVVASTSNPGASIDSYGVIVGLESDLSDGITTTINGSISTNPFSVVLTNLTNGVTYYYRVFVTDQTRTSSSSISTFMPRGNVININNGTTRVNNGTIRVQ